ncbi:hypothetical protein LCGC14_1049210 [marine sediment metagenome]|uniref:ParB-like N-terminal domain-containing protein n=1 Tax=marine sediment metagenome TaxID=412755 RepID=A0A0F9QVF1_9ZZZZ
MKIKLADLKVDPTVNIRDRLDGDTVEKYESIFEILPPILVFRINGNYLLADGFHRYQAADNLGKLEIEAEVREGTLEDAQEANIRENAAHHGLSLKVAEQARAIDWFVEHRSDWTDQQIAEAVGAPKSTVHNHRRALLSGKQASVNLPQRYARQLHDVPAPEAQKLANLQQEKKWTPEETRMAARAVKNPKTDPLYRSALLAGAAPPVKVQEDGTHSVLVGPVQKEIAARKKGDVLYQLLTALSAVARFQAAFTVKDIKRDVSTKQAADIMLTLPSQVAFLAAIEKALRDDR